MFRIGVSRVGEGRIGRPEVDEPRRVAREGHCPVDGARGVFRRTALVCPRCGRLLGGF
jgi:hypothetical protein